jgi:hypothetical protein
MIAAATKYFTQKYLDPETLFICNLLDKFVEIGCCTKITESP